MTRAWQSPDVQAAPGAIPTAAPTTPPQGDSKRAAPGAAVPGIPSTEPQAERAECRARSQLADSGAQGFCPPQQLGGAVSRWGPETPVEIGHLRHPHSSWPYFLFAVCCTGGSALPATVSVAELPAWTPADPKPTPSSSGAVLTRQPETEPEPAARAEMG